VLRENRHFVCAGIILPSDTLDLEGFVVQHGFIGWRRARGV